MGCRETEESVPRPSFSSRWAVGKEKRVCLALVPVSLLSRQAPLWELWAGMRRGLRRTPRGGGKPCAAGQRQGWWKPCMANTNTCQASKQRGSQPKAQLAVCRPASSENRHPHLEQDDAVELEAIKDSVQYKPAAGGATGLLAQEQLRQGAASTL